MIKEEDTLTNTIFTDEEIMGLTKVTPQIASSYLGVPVRNIQEGMQNNVLPIGYAYKKNEWVYVIMPERLIRWKHGLDMAI